MNSKTIKPILEKLTGVPEKFWRRIEKFSFSNEVEFTSKSAVQMSFEYLEGSEWVQGTLPSSGKCRVFVAHHEGQDFCAHALSGSTEYISISSD